MALAKDLASELGAFKADCLGDTQEDGITSAGNSQGTAYPLKASINRVTGGTAVTGDCLRLPAIASFKPSSVSIRSDFIGFALNVFPASGESINGLAANASYSLPAGSGITFRKASSTIWIVA